MTSVVPTLLAMTSVVPMLLAMTNQGAQLYSSLLGAKRQTLLVIARSEATRQTIQQILKHQMNNFLTATPAIIDLSLKEIFLNLMMSLSMGVGIFIFYKKTFHGVLYQKTFNVSLVVIAILLTFIIMIIRGNLILSLGMIGALSIVRFRTPIKDPIDLIFIFWAISIGIANGVGLFHISAIASLLIALTIFTMLKLKETEKSYLLILHLSDQKSEQKILELIKESVGKYTLKSKTISPDLIEIILEIRLKNNDTNFINQLSGINKATLISANENL